MVIIKRFNEMPNLVFLGPPGAGKGTMSNILSKEYGFNIICTGDLLRSEKNSGSDLGKKIANLIDNGKLVPDDIVDEIVEKEINKFNDSIILDGYPRTIKQAENLDRLLNDIKVIWMDIPEELTIERNLERGKTSNRPDDSNKDVIKTRLDDFYKESLPVKDWYKKTNRVDLVDASGSIDEVLEIIKSLI
jgi:adenylate kinase